MSKRTSSQIPADQRSGGWDSLVASVDDLLRRRPATNHQPGVEQPQSVLHGRIDHGVSAVPIYRIALNPPGESPFDRVLPPDAPIAIELPLDDKIRPIELYKVGETYFVRDGNRRVAAARSRSQLFLRAHVVEYICDQPARIPDVLSLLISQERIEFFNRAPFPAGHPAYSFYANSLGVFEALACHIQQVCSHFEHEQAEHQPLLAWYNRVYLPVARLIRRRHLLNYFPGSSEIELFLWAVNRDGHWNDERPLAAHMLAARRALASLWVALQNQAGR